MKKFLLLGVTFFGSHTALAGHLVQDFECSNHEYRINTTIKSENYYISIDRYGSDEGYFEFEAYRQLNGTFGKKQIENKTGTISLRRISGLGLIGNRKLKLGVNPQIDQKGTNSFEFVYGKSMKKGLLLSYDKTLQLKDAAVLSCL